jgi:hypothetical protein
MNVGENEEAELSNKDEKQINLNSNTENIDRSSTFSANSGPNNSKNEVTVEGSNNLQEETPLTAGLPEESAEIGSNSAKEAEAVADEEDLGIFLGDRVRIYSKKYGKVEGYVYYLDMTRILRILPYGVSNMLYEFPLEQVGTDPDGDPEYDFIEELGIEQVPELIGKGPREGFAKWHNFQVGQELETINKKGEITITYLIKNVDYENDRIRVDVLGEEKERDIDFNEKGFEDDLHQGDEKEMIIRIKVQPEEPGDELIVDENVAAAKAVEEELEENIAEEDIEFEIMGTFEVTIPTQMIDQPEYERVYPELQQKNEMLEDLLSILDSASQKNPAIQKNIRTLIEMLSALKNTVVARDENGIPIGEQKISVSSLNDIFINNYVPMARPVLDTKRVLVAESEEDIGEDQNIIIEPLEPIIESSIEFLKNNGNRPSGNRTEGSLPAFFGVLEEYFKNFPLGDKYSSYGFSLPKDMEFFRKDAPNQEDDIYGLTVLGTDKKDKKAPKFEPATIRSWIESIKQSYRRGHGPTMMPFDKNSLGTAIPGDKAPLVGQVLFPYSSIYTGGVGSTRTGKLWDDMLRSNVGAKMWMEYIIELFGGVTTDTNDINNILYFKENDNKAINTPFDKYLELVLKSLILKGPGDISVFKNDLGIEDFELNLEQQKAVSDRVLQIIASVRSEIASLREEEPTVDSDKKDVKQIISENYYTEIRKKIEEYPDLHPLLSDFDSRLPGYSKRNVDIALFSFLYYYIPDYLFAILGNNKVNMVAEYQKFKRNIILKKLQDEQKYKTLQRNRGVAPKPNPCKHVAELTACRRVKDPLERNKLLVELLKTFQGLANENWITCQVCRQNFICRHELLQLQQFINPKEYNVIQKKIVLDFAGGAYGRKHICKNCGEGIDDIDFDKHVEYTDEGVPRQDLLFDKDEERERILNMMMGIRVDKMDEITFESTQKTEIYRILKVIQDEIGIAIVNTAIREIIDRADGYIKLLPTEDDYIEQMKGKRALSYGQYLSQHKIAIVGALVLIEIQTRIPTYTPKFVIAGCDPSFGGFPIEAESDPQNSEQIGGIKYVACAIAGIVRDDNPWESGFQFISSDEARKKRITNLLVNYTQVLTQDVTIQHLLAQKRRHLIAVAQVKKVAEKNEKIPNGFLPKMETAAESLENASRERTVNESVNSGSLGDILRADKWMREANGIIRETAVVVKASPYAESSCCFDIISSPGKFWKEAQQNKLPPMPRYSFVSPLYVRNSYLYTQLQVRPLKGVNVDLPIYLAYQLLLKVCYRGPHVGLPHEIGYDNKCDWCDIEIPSQILHADVDVYGNPIINQEELKSSLDLQQIVLDETGFQKLLDDIHKRTEFLLYIKPVPKTPDQILQRLGEIQYEPIPGFAESLQKSKDNLLNLQDTTSKTEIQTALIPLRQNLNESESFIIRKFGDKGKEIFGTILREPPQTIFEILLAFFLTPAQRLLEVYNAEGIMRVPRFYKLGTEHTMMLDKLLGEHTSYMTQFDLFPDTEDGEEDLTLLKARNKLAIFVEQLSEINKLSSELRISRMKFDPKLTDVQVQMFFNQIMKALVLGPIGGLCNPDVNPESPDGIEPPDPANSDQFLIRFVSMCLIKYKKEVVAYNPEKTKQKIAESKEMEAQRFVKKLDRMSPEERQVELTKKKYGYGDWAIGGTKLVYSYDADQWLKNTEAAQMDYARASGFTPEADLPIDITDIDLTGYVDREGLQEQGLGYEYKLYDEDDE